MFNKMRDEYLILLSEERDEYLDIFDKQDRTFKHLIESEKIEREKLARSLQIQLDSILKDSNKKQEKIKEFVDEISKFIILTSIPTLLFSLIVYSFLKSLSL